MHSSRFFQIKPIAKLISKVQILQEVVLFSTNPYYKLLSTTVLNDYVYIVPLNRQYNQCMDKLFNTLNGNHNQI